MADKIVEEDLSNIAEAIKAEAKVLEGKTLLITGGSGFIGSYFIATIDLLNSKYFKKPCKVISLDNHIVGKSNNLIKEINSSHVNYIGHDVTKPFETKEPIDYMILDLIMPVMNGFEVIEAMQKEKIKVPLLVLSNLGQKEDIEKINSLGVTDYFIKANTPISELATIVNEKF